MKKKAKWLVPTFLFVLGALLLFGKISETLRRKSGQAVDMMHVLYEQSKNDGPADVLCLGSSHGYWSFNANCLWGQYGISALSMCSPTQTIATSYYALREALKYEKPKVVLLESYYFYVGEKYVKKKQNPQLRKAFDGLRNDEVKLEMLSDFFGKGSVREKLSFLVPFVLYHGRWDDLRSYDFHPWHFLRGSALGFHVYPMEEPEKPQKVTEISEVNKEYFEKILALCKEQKISLVVYAAPYGHDGDVDSYQRKQGYNVMLESYLKEKNVPFLFYQKMDEINFDYKTDFLNATHLNTPGSIKLSENLGAWLQKTYDLKDHRGDERFLSYEKDYEQYQTAVENKAEASE